MNLLDQVIDHINVKAPDCPEGFDITILPGHKENLVRIFNKGDCGFLYDTGCSCEQFDYVGWAPTEDAAKRREAYR